MAWASPDLIIGGVKISVPQALNLSQSYEDIGGVATLRMGSGRAVRQSYWTKLKTTINGAGQIPSGLFVLDWTVSHEISCIEPRSVFSATASTTLPAARRSDVPPIAWGWVNGYPVVTPVTVAINTATATAVNGASYYLFAYFPKFTALLTRSEGYDRSNGEYNWTINAEEI